MLTSFAKNTKIKTKLIIVFILPVIALISLAANQMARMWSNAESVRVAQELIGTSIDISQLVGELQKERGLSAGYVGSVGKLFGADIRIQRQATDTLINSLPGFLDSLPRGPEFANLKAAWRDVLITLEQRPAFHVQVDALNVGSDYWAYYSELIGDAINLVQQTPVRGDDLEYARLIHAYTILLWLEERSGQERGMMSNVISAGYFTPETFRTLNGYVAQQEALIEEFHLIASAEEWGMLNTVLMGPEASRVSELRQSVTYRLSKSDLLNQIQSQIGYGGLIHHFKNYVLRGADRYHMQFLDSFETAKSIIVEYRSLPGMSVTEQAAIDEIAIVLHDYRDNIDIVTKMRDAGDAPLSIDAVVIVDDKPALKAIETLRKYIAPTGAEEWFSITTTRLSQITNVRNTVKGHALAHMEGLTRQANWVLASYAGGTVLILGILMVLGGFVSNRLLSGIASISRTLKKVEEQGDYSEKVPLDGNDEIAVMTQRINNHLNALEDALGRVNAILSNAANGDFTKPSGTKDLPGDLGKLMHGVETSTQRIEVSMAEQEQTAKTLRKATAEAVDANRSKSEFLSSMSHELRTPLNAILGFAQLLRMDSNNPLNTKQKASVNHIEKGGEHLLELINEVLDLAQIESGSFSITIKSVHPNEVIEDSLRMAHAIADKYAVSVQDRTLTAQLPLILADPARVKQILLNLLSNAIKYNRKGGIAILEAMEMPDGMVRFKVTDNGPGIDIDQQKDLFTPFSRLGQEGKEIEGTGIGLTITQKLVERMDGMIGFESEPGRGSSFWVDLPMAAMNGSGEWPSGERVAPKISPAPLAPLPVAGGGMHKVLYIEDNPANLRLMEDIIDTFTDVEMISAHTAEIGLVMAAREKPDLILMDINLPGINGDEAMRELKHNSAISDIPVIAISANAIPKDIERYMQAGFLDYLAKPFDVQKVIHVIRDTLEGT